MALGNLLGKKKPLEFIRTIHQEDASLLSTSQELKIFTYETAFEARTIPE
jgi:hypothetical protein